jgi:hypothetical protein
MKKHNKVDFYIVIIKRLLHVFKKQKKTFKRHSFINQSNTKNVLITYENTVFNKRQDDPWLNGHANRKQALIIKNIFYNSGFNVDFIHHEDIDFIPQKKYDIIFGHEPLYSLLVEKINFDIKIYYATTLSWVHRNKAIKERTSLLENKKGFKIKSVKDYEHYSWKNSDAVFYFGNKYFLKTIEKKK